MDPRERYEQAEEAMRAMLDGFSSRMWTAIPGIIQSYDATKMAASVQPTVERVNTADGSREKITLLDDVPVVFPGGGGYTLTFPVNAGDECLVIFASRSIDSWWQSGGVQAPVSARTHSLSDGFAIVGLRSLARSLSPAASADSVQLRNDAGTALVAIKGSGEVSIKAPGKLKVEGDIEATGDIKAGTVSLRTHVHGNVQSGASNTGTPVP